MSWWTSMIEWFRKLAAGTPAQPDQPAPASPAVPAPASPTSGQQVGRACVCVGLTAVDPAANGGWDGPCPGCDIDAIGLRNHVERHGIMNAMLLNARATWAGVQAAVYKMASGLVRGDLLVITISGHGGQVPDDSGDELDEQDETICLWDGQVRDDLVLDLLHELPPGLRVVLISDQCHSEGNFRSAVRVAQRAVSMGRWGRREARPLVRRAQVWDGALLQFAGCREEDYSYGSKQGGTWTQSLLAAWREGMTWTEWFDAAKARMPGRQVPVMVEYGRVDDAFRNGEALR